MKIKDQKRNARIRHCLNTYFFIILFGFIIYAQCISAGETKTTKKTQQANFAKEPFNIAQETLPKNYIGHNFFVLYDALKKIPPKSEFESTNDYEQRLSKYSSTPFWSSLTSTSLLAFSVRDLTTAYDADYKLLKITYDGDFCDKGDVGFKLFSHYKKVGDYTGVNAFNRKIKVQQGVQSSCLICFPNCIRKYQGGESIFEIRSLKVSIKLDSTRAITAKNNIALLVIGNLRPPFIDSASYRTEPTIDYPYDTMKMVKNILIDVSAMWIYDMVSGEIYEKIEKCTHSGSENSEYYHFLF